MGELVGGAGLLHGEGSEGIALVRFERTVGPQEETVTGQGRAERFPLCREVDKRSRFIFQGELEAGEISKWKRALEDEPGSIYRDIFAPWGGRTQGELHGLTQGLFCGDGDHYGESHGLLIDQRQVLKITQSRCEEKVIEL